MDHHIAFFLSFVARKVKGSFGVSVGIFFESEVSPLGGDVICLAYIHIVQAGRVETVSKHQVIDIMATTAVLFVLWYYLWLKEQMLKLNAVFLPFFFLCM